MDPGAAAAGYPQSAVVGLASLSGAHVVGPLLLSNAFAWALWGTLTVQLYIFVLAQSKFGSARAKPRNAQTHRKGFVLPLPFVRETRRGAETGPGAGVEAKSSGAEGSGGRRRFRAGSELFADADVNPWTLSVSFAAPNSPSTYEVDTQKQHARQQSSRSGLSSSEPYVAEHVDAGYPGADGIRQVSVRPADATPSSSLSQLLARSGAGEPRDDDLQWGSGNSWAKARPPPPSFFFWRVAVGGWNTILPASNLGPGGPGLGVHRWVGTVVADCVCPVVFLISMLYFMHALFLSPCACPPSAPADASTKHRSLSGFANKNSKSRTSLRPLSLLKPRTPSVDYAAHPYPLFPRTEDCFSPRTPTANGTSADGGHVQPVPSRASRFVRRVRRAFTGSGKETGIGFGRFVQPALLFVTAAVVAACGLVDSGRVSLNFYFPFFSLRTLFCPFYFFF
ncbi:hypothetical protein DFH11DRAFT_485498 [Phellopilus nigrolimitatus]|nr:hypothetical protein DFH11DRAFT_485498 [Phellopilus nigrolimitatus]